MVRSGGVDAKNGRVRIRIQHNGQRRTIILEQRPTQACLAAAQRLHTEIKQRLRLGESFAALSAELTGESYTDETEERTLGFYAQHLLDNAETLTRSTLMSYETIYNRYWAVFDDRSVSSIQLTELQQHINSFDVVQKTKKNAVSLLRLIFDLAKSDQIITRAPTDHWEFKRAKRNTRSQPDPYTIEERDYLIAALLKQGQQSASNMIAWRYFLMGFHSGMRTGELLGAMWRDYEPPYFRVWQQRVRRKMVPHTKTGNERLVLLPPIVTEMLNANPTSKASDHLFTSPENHPFLDADWLMEKWSKAHKVCGVRQRTGPYPWRHTYISIGLTHGQHVNWIAKQCGHSPTMVERVYGKWIVGSEELDRIELSKVYAGESTKK